MGRPTDEKKDRTIKIRLSEEMYEAVEKRGGNLSETLRNLIREGIMPRKEGTKKPLENDYLSRLEGICRYKAEEKLKAKKIEELRLIPETELKRLEETPRSGFMSSSTQRELEDMCRISGIETSYFMERVKDLFKDGRIYIEGLRVNCRGEYDLRTLENLCHRGNIDVQDMIDKIVKSMLRG